METIAYVSNRGIPFQQLFQLVPALAPFYTSAEANYDVIPIQTFVKNHWEIPFGCVALYLAGIFFGTKFMDKVDYKNIWDTRGVLAAWNALLCIFSFTGALRTVPHLLYNLKAQSFESTICTPPDQEWGVGATGLWVQLFILSKIPELIDTVFIVQRKRPLIFLHWYHHVTVLLYCWHSYATEASQALYFVAMNYSVHAVMYGYYCLMALKIKPPIPPVAITVFQISQMVVGTFIQCAAMMYYSEEAGKCGVHYGNLVAGGLMYGSYFALFFQFAIKRFVLTPKKEDKKVE
mmetsp:Transcript_51880/g.89068  ORF Transcript_51880/g.89068 Transcript_51880/m.89068 type:complete len:291 (+) Transcript_51880:54-926(+)